MTMSTGTPQAREIRLRSGLQLEYVEQGLRGGPTLLLLHGITDTWRSFEPVLPWLPRDWHVLALSQRGHGGSSTPTTYRTRDFAQDAAAFAEELSLRPFIVVGHSMGAANAMRLAIDRPDLVRGVVAAGAFASFSDKQALVDYVHSTIMLLDDSVPRELAEAFQRETVAGPLPAGLLDTMVDECLRTPASVWRAAFLGLLEDDFSAAVSRIAVRVLLAWGDADSFVPEADQERLAHQIPRAVRSIYRGVGHALHWEQPERFAHDVQRFVELLNGQHEEHAVAAS
jgi:pimeloyl-ACP methyl ester carboxylesterase